MGYEKYREHRASSARRRWASCPPTPSSRRSIRTSTRRARMASRGTRLDVTRPWDSLNADEKKLFTRMAEVYAGFLSHADHHIGRLLDYLEESGQLDNTIIVLVSDNGASGEGGPNGSVNENKFFNGIPDTIEENMKYLDVLGSPDDLQPLPHRLGLGVQHAVQDVQALQLRRRHRRPDDGLLAEGDQGQRRASATSSTTPSTSCPPSTSVWASSCRKWSRAIPRLPLEGISFKYSFEDGRRSRPKGNPVLLDAGLARASGTRAGKPSRFTRRSPGGATSPRIAGSCTTRARIRPKATTLPQAPGKAAGADQPLVP